jgi:ubiquinone biosynthesis protein
VAGEFAQALRQQLDLRLEAHHNRRFAENFAGDAELGVPPLHEALCTRRVLCMDFVHGRKILDDGRPAEERQRLARAGFRLLLEMIFSHGFVHADLHPGNLLVTPEGQVVMLDLGLVASLGRQQRQVLQELMLAWLARDAGRVCELMLRLLPETRRAPLPGPFREQVAALMDRYRTLELGQIQLGQVMLELLRLMRRHAMRVEPALTMVVVSIGVLEGVGRQLAPDMDLVSEALRLFGPAETGASGA